MLRRQSHPNSSAPQQSEAQLYHLGSILIINLFFIIIFFNFQSNIFGLIFFLVSFLFNMVFHGNNYHQGIYTCLFNRNTTYQEYLGYVEKWNFSKLLFLVESQNFLHFLIQMEKNFSSMYVKQNVVCKPIFRIEKFPQITYFLIIQKLPQLQFLCSMLP